MLALARPLACAVAPLLTFPVWAGIITNNPVVRDAFKRGSGALGHRPEFKYSSLLLVLLILLMLWRSSSWANRWFAVVYLSASLLVMNIQVITGKTIQPQHWAGYYIQPLFLLFFIDFLWTLKAKNHRILWRMVAVILLAAGILTSVYKLSIGARQAIDFNRRDPAFEQLLTLLHQPRLHDYGFLSNDEYVTSVLPAFVIQKPLRPLYHDPLSQRKSFGEEFGEVSNTDVRTSSGLGETAKVVLDPMQCQQMVGKLLEERRNILNELLIIAERNMFEGKRGAVQSCDFNPRFLADANRELQRALDRYFSLKDRGL